ncbi:MAG: insulinase family protein [Segetibacter sp.]|nr:insulinase family protein [Segetibacter sp.]
MKCFLPVLLCVTVALTASAQVRLPRNYFFQKLDNGLEIVVIENPKVPLATIEIAVKNGAYTEGPEYSGLSHLFEHMFFKANKDYPNQEKFLKRTQELGAIWNGTTGEERVNYFFTFHKDSLQAGLNFMNSAIRFPIYRTEDMQKERPVVDGEFQRSESDPGFQLQYECGKRLWGDLFTRKNPIGDHNIINTATPEKMMVIKNKYYYPDNSLLTVSGDVNHEEVFSRAKQTLGGWVSSGFNIFEKYPIPEFPPLTASQYFVKESSIAQTPYLNIYWHGPDYRKDSAATVAADVFSAVLQLNSSKWQQALIDKGLATYAYEYYQTSKYTGPIAITVLPNPQKLKECYAEIMNQVKMWANNDYFTDEQLNVAKQVLRRNFVRQQEKPSTLGINLSFWWCSTSIDYFTDYQSNLQKVTKDDIQKFVKTYIKDKPHVAGMIINPAMNKEAKAETFFKATSF